MDSFRRSAIVQESPDVLQRQVDDLDQLKSRHYEEIIEHEEKCGMSCKQGNLTTTLPHEISLKEHDLFGRFPLWSVRP